MLPSYDHVVVVGASAGGVHALLAVAQRLPDSFPAPVCIVQHIGGNPSLLPELLRFRGPNRAVHAEQGQRLVPGTLHVAPPDAHMLLEGDCLRLTQGPKENHARPAIDPLFRSAAWSKGPAVIGVILTGQMEDGAAGLRAIKDRGGTAVVQDPASAAEPAMPRAALRNVEVDHCVPLLAIAPLLVRLVGMREPGARPAVPQDVVREVAGHRAEASVEDLQDIASPARARRHASEHAIWSSVRALREREMLLRRMATVSATLGEAGQARVAQAQADRIRKQCDALQEFAGSAPPATITDAHA